MPNIEVIVRELQSGEGTSPSQQSMAKGAGETPSNEDSKASKQTEAQKALLAGIINVAKQQAMNGAQQYGNLTGNYTAVMVLNNALELASDIGIIAKGGIAGAIFVASKHTIALVNSSINQMNATREQDFRNQLLGKVALQGSRY
jgi:hypothetical protein